MARKYYNDNYSVLGIEKGEMLKSSQKKAPEDEKIFVRYDEGAKKIFHVPEQLYAACC